MGRLIVAQKRIYCTGGGGREWLGVGGSNGSSIQWKAVSDGVLRDTERRSATRLNLDSIMDTKRYLPTKISITKASPLSDDDPLESRHQDLSKTSSTDL